MAEGRGDGKERGKGSLGNEKEWWELGGGLELDRGDRYGFQGRT